MREGKRTLKNRFIFMTGKSLILFIIFSTTVFAQPKPKMTPKPDIVINSPNPPDTPWNDDIPFEKSIAVEPKVNVRLCVTEGNIKVNGWERNEVRIFIREGSKAGFNVNIKDKKSGKPVLLTIEGHDQETDPDIGHNKNCLSGEEIELDMPREATLSLKGGDVQINVEEIATVTLQNETGEVSLRNISRKIEAKAYDCDVMVENSSGAVNVESIDGNILIHNAEPSEIGDTFRAKTNGGSLVLQSIKHNIVEASSISGQIRFSGEIQSEGQYVFNNTSGLILLAIPLESSFNFQVLSQNGKFTSELPLKFLTDDKLPSVRRQTGRIGNGGMANINLVNASGRIFIKKIN